jgi:tetratricopeptide (TPR) repeat protein
MLRALLATALLASSAGSHPARPDDVDTGVRLFESQRYAEARASLESAVREHPTDARAAEYLGRTLFEESQPEAAARELERAAALDASSSSIQYWLGRAYGEQAIRGGMLLRAKLAGRVRRSFERARELDPGNTNARMALLEFYLRAPAFMGGSPQKAEREAEEIRRRDPMRGHRAAARLYESRKRFDLASAEYEAAARDFPGRPEPYYWIEDAAIDRKDWTAAFSAVERLEHAASGETRALYETGRLAALSGRELERGEAALRRYLEREHQSDEAPAEMAHFHLGEILEKRGDKRRAREEYAAALQIDPLLTEARQALARLR